MAEILAEKKSGLGWLWILLALILAALLLWWLFSAGDDDYLGRDADDAGVVATDDAAMRAGMPTAGAEMTLAAILADPSAYYGRESFPGVPVSEIEIRDDEAYIDPVDATGFNAAPVPKGSRVRGPVTVQARA